MFTRALRWFWYVVVVRGLVLILLGVNVRHRERLPKQGPALIVANHNSHLDAMVLMSLLPASQIHAAHPVAAADYFLRNPLVAWFALNILGIIPISRRMARGEADPLQPCVDALEAGRILIIFPEGSRGEPEELAEFKRGIARLKARAPEVPVVPVFMHGLGKALPRGEFLLVPFFCDIFAGEPVPWQDDRRVFMDDLQRRMGALAEEGNFSAWE